MGFDEESDGKDKNASVRSNNAKKAQKRTKQVLFMTICVTIVFLMCWCFQSLANLIRSIPGSTEWYGDPTLSGNGQNDGQSGQTGQSHQNGQNGQFSQNNQSNSCETCKLRSNP